MSLLHGPNGVEIKVTDEEEVDDTGQVEHQGSSTLPQILELQSCSQALWQKTEP